MGKKNNNYSHKKDIANKSKQPMNSKLVNNQSKISQPSQELLCLKDSHTNKLEVIGKRHSERLEPSSNFEQYELMSNSKIRSFEISFYSFNIGKKTKKEYYLTKTKTQVVELIKGNFTSSNPQLEEINIKHLLINGVPYHGELTKMFFIALAQSNGIYATLYCNKDDFITTEDKIKFKANSTKTSLEIYQIKQRDIYSVNVKELGNKSFLAISTSKVLNHSSHLTTFNLTNSFYSKLKKRDTISLIKATAPLQPSAQNTPEKNDLSNTQIKNENQSTREEQEVVSLEGKKFLFIFTDSMLKPLAIFENEKLSYIPETQESMLSQYSFMRKGKILKTQEIGILGIPDNSSLMASSGTKIFPLKTNHTIAEVIIPQNIQAIQSNIEIDKNKVIEDFITGFPFNGVFKYILLVAVAQTSDTYVVAVYRNALKSHHNGRIIDINRLRIGKSINLYSIPKSDIMYFENCDKFVIRRQFEDIINGKSFFSSILIEEKHFSKVNQTEKVVSEIRPAQEKEETTSDGQNVLFITMKNKCRPLAVMENGELKQIKNIPYNNSKFRNPIIKNFPRNGLAILSIPTKLTPNSEDGKITSVSPTQTDYVVAEVIMPSIFKGVEEINSIKVTDFLLEGLDLKVHLQPLKVCLQSSDKHILIRIAENSEHYIIALCKYDFLINQASMQPKLNEHCIGKSVDLFAVDKSDVIFFEDLDRYVLKKDISRVLDEKNPFSSLVFEKNDVVKSMSHEILNSGQQKDDEVTTIKRQIEKLYCDISITSECIEEQTSLKSALEEKLSQHQSTLTTREITPELEQLKGGNLRLNNELMVAKDKQKELHRVEQAIITNFQCDVADYLKGKISLASKNYIIKQGIKPNNIEEVSISDFNTLDEKLRGNLLSFGMKEEYVKGYTRFIITSALAQGNFIICGSYYKEVADSLSLLLTGKSAGEVYLDQGASYGADLLKAIGDMPDKVILIHHALDTYNESLFLSLIKEEQEKIFFFTYEKEAHSSCFSINVGKMVYFLDVDPFFTEAEKSPHFTGIFDIQSLIPEIELTSKEIPNQLLEILPESSFEIISTFLNLQKQVYQNGKITFTLLRSIKFCVEESVFDQYIQELSKTPSLKGLVAKWKL